MSRSKWKGPYLNLKNLDLKETNLKKNQDIYVITRNSEIIPRFLDLTFNIYNGKNYKKITVTNLMIGHKFGEFVFTRGKFSFKNKKKKK